jgi:hypothetical protein
MLETLLQQYTILLEDLDETCQEATKNIPEIPCRKGCSDCCKQLFPLSFIEAFYINEGFKKLDRKTRRELERKAEKQKNLLKDLKLETLETFSNSLEDVAKARNDLTHTLQSTNTECPFLTQENICELYPYRNHDCRVHGVSFDKSTGEIVGCFRHPKTFDTPTLKSKFVSKSVPSNHLYKEKSKLDSLLAVELGQNPDLKYCYYFTTPYEPLIQDYRTMDWPKFFKDKLKTTEKNPTNKYSLIIHV